MKISITDPQSDLLIEVNGEVIYNKTKQPLPQKLTDEPTGAQHYYVAPHPINASSPKVRQSVIGTIVSGKNRNLERRNFRSMTNSKIRYPTPQ